MSETVHSQGRRVVSNDDLLAAFRWRYATKRFDATRKISSQDWETLEQTMLLAPSSFGLQPWRFVVVQNPAIREKIKAVAWGQTQVTDASHLVVFAVRKTMDALDVQKLIDRTSAVRNMPADALETAKQMMLGTVSKLSREEMDEWCARQVYIALGFFLASAATLGIDACPMEGFDPKQVTEILGLQKHGYSALVLATAGYRSPDDKYGKLPKVRYAHEDVIMTI
jgi:nitroreductase